MPDETFDLYAVNRFILHKQRLTGGPRHEGIAEVTRHVGGLHNTGPSTPYLSLFARMPDFSRSMLDEEMYVRKSLIRIRCMRNTLHILPREILPAAFVATLKCTGANADRFLQYRGVSDEEFEKVSGRVTTLLAGGGRTIAQIKKAVGPATSLPAVLTLLCDRGILVRGETPNWRSNAYTYHLFSEYLPGLSLDSIGEHDAILELARTYFAAFGPATAADFAWWSGLGKTRARDALKELPVAHIEVGGLEGDFVLMHDDLPTLKATESGIATTVSFLPGLDPYVMGYKVRERYLSGESYGFVFDRSGNSANTIVVNGRLSGVWDCPADEGPLVKYFLFEEVDKATRRQVVAEAHRMGTFICGHVVSVKECRSMVPLPRRSAGAVMSPLKGQ